MDVQHLANIGLVCSVVTANADASRSVKKYAKTLIPCADAESPAHIRTKALQKVATNLGKESAPLCGLVDIDANFLHDEFCGDGVIDSLRKSAHSVGVAQFVTPACTLEDCARAVQLAIAHPEEIFVTAGVHPYWSAVQVCNAPRESGVDYSDAAFEQLCEFARNDVVRAIGECGLDFVRPPTQPNGFPSFDSQMPWFEAQVKLACELRKPLFLHIRSAFLPAMEVLKKHSSDLPPAVVHAFTGEEQELEAFRKLDFFIGVTGYICQKSVKLRDWLPKHVPLDRLMVETDAPYMGFKGCRTSEAVDRQGKYPNVPAALPKVVMAVAECYQVSPQEVAHVTSATARSFFSM